MGRYGKGKNQEEPVFGIPDKSNLGVRGKLLLPELLRLALKKNMAD